MNSTEGMSWPDTLRWLAEHEGQAIEFDDYCGNWLVWNGQLARKDFTYRLARRKPRVGKMGVHHKQSIYQEVDAVELIPGMVVQTRQATWTEICGCTCQAEYDQLMSSLRVDIDE